MTDVDQTTRNLAGIGVVLIAIFSLVLLMGVVSSSVTITDAAVYQNDQKILTIGTSNFYKADSITPYDYKNTPVRIQILSGEAELAGVRLQPGSIVEFTPH